MHDAFRNRWNNPLIDETPQPFDAEYQRWFDQEFRMATLRIRLAQGSYRAHLAHSAWGLLETDSLRRHHLFSHPMLPSSGRARFEKAEVNRAASLMRSSFLHLS